VPSNPVLAPKSLGLVTAAELELDRNDIVESLVQRGCLEAAGKVAKGDSWKGGSRFGVLEGEMLVWRFVTGCRLETRDIAD
jgi:hypothetical protein